MQWFAEDLSVDEALRFIRFWLGSIATHACGRKDGSLPPIVLVGTHKDQVVQCRFTAELEKQTGGDLFSFLYGLISASAPQT